MKKIKLFLAALLAIVGASSMKALEPADLAGNYLWNYKEGNVDRENTVSIAVSGDELTISDMFLDPLKATIQEEGGDTYLVIAKGQRGTSSSGYEYEVQGSADGSSGWGEADIKGKIGTDGVITFDCYLRASIVDMPDYTIGLYYGKGSTFTPLSGELPSVVELPTGATVDDYQLAYQESGKRKTKAVGVAIVGSDVYVQGFADFLPEAWVKGTKVGNNWVFPEKQYLGKYGNYDCYFFSNGETTFTYNGEDAYVATQVSGTVAGVVSALYIEPELSEEFDPVPYATISIDGENMTFRYDLDYYSASEEVGTSFSHVYRLPWTGYQPEWWNDAETLKKIKKVSFNASFGEYEDITDLFGFFAGMENLTTIEGLGYLVTKNAKHTASMFENCKSLTSLDLSTFDTSGITDGTMASMFSGCESLESITFGEKFSTAGAYDMQYMFGNCNALESLDLSKFDTGKVTNMANMFSGCKSLKSITFGEKFSTAGAKDMNAMFYNCKALKSLDLSSFDTGNVTDMQYMFGNCKALESLDVSNFNTEKVTTMQGMFYGCKALKELDMSNFDTGNVETMSYMFRECKALESLNLSSFNTGKVQEMYDMFYECSSLQTIYSAEGADWSSVEKSSQMFYGCTNLSGKYGSKKFEYNGTVDGTYAMVYLGTAYGGYFTSIKEKPEPYAVLSSDGKTLTFYYDNQKGKKTETVYLIPWTGNTPGWYESQNNVTTVTFDESFKDYDGLTTTRNMFNQFGKLETINHLEYLNTENVTDMANMFWYCGKLKTLDVSNFNTEKVTDMSSMFRNCTSLETLDLSNFNTAKVTTMNAMFSESEALETIYCNDDWATMNENQSSLNSSGMFYWCIKLKGAVAYEYGTTKDDVSMANPTQGFFTAREAYAVLSKDGKTLTFYYDENKKAHTKEVGRVNVFAIPWSSRPGWTNKDAITTATFDESFKNYHGLTSTRTMFAELTGLKTINHLEYLDTENVENMQYMFNGCSSLETIDLSSIDTKKVTNMGAMFYGCSSLKTIDLSNFNTQKVMSMNYMFNDCSSLETIYCAEGTDWSGVNGRTYTNMFAGCSKLSGKCGGEEFKFDENFTDGTYARVYTGDDEVGGYFTSSSLREAYAVLSSDGTTLTFYYDASKAAWLEKAEIHECTVYDIPWDDTPRWRNSTITTVTFDKSFGDYHGLTNTSYMFSEMKALNTINNLKYLNTENVTDMHYMFTDCYALETLELGDNFNTSSVTDMDNMFCNCENLTTLDLGDNFDTSSVTDMHEMFSICKSLEALDFGDKFNTSSVTDMKKMFCNCENLTTLDLGDNFDTSSVTDMHEMFSTCKSLEALDLGDNFDTSSVTDMKKMFYYCEKLNPLDLGEKFNTSSVTDMSYMFGGCKALKTLDLSNFDTSNVEDMSMMFGYCQALETIYCAEGTDWSGVNGRSYDDMFYYCSNLSGKYRSNSFECDGENDIDGTYAKVYTGDDEEGGYFTYKGNEDYVLTVTKAGMATLYLDYNAKIPDDVQVFYCTGLGDDEAVPTTHAVEIDPGSLIPANTGVFVKAAEGEYKFEHPKSGQTYMVAPIINNILRGSVKETKVNAHEVLTLGYANNADETLGFWWYTGTTIPANRAYIPGDKLPAEVKGIRLLFDEETGIATTNLMNQTNEADAWYTIDGRKLEGKPQQRGLYINNGKKIMVK